MAEVIEHKLFDSVTAIFIYLYPPGAKYIILFSHCFFIISFLISHVPIVISLVVQLSTQIPFLSKGILCHYIRAH